MPWIDTTIQERDFGNDLLVLLEEQGWTLASHFKKISVDSRWVDPTNPKQQETVIEWHMAEHFIYESAAGFKYGIAFYGMQSMLYGTVDKAHRPDAVWKPTSGNGGTDFIAEKLDKLAMEQWITNIFPPCKLSSTVYMYQVEQVDDSLTTNEDISIIWPGASKRSSLDIEVKQTKGFLANGNFSVLVQENHDWVMQSPIAQVNLRIPSIEQRLVQYGEKGVLQAHNVWDDSLVRVKGYVTSDRLLVTLTADTAMAFEHNATPTIPLFWGNLQTTKKVIEIATKAELPQAGEKDTAYRVISDESRENKVTEYVMKNASWEPQLLHDTLLAGSAWDAPSPKFDFDAITPFRAPLMPLLKSYTANPSNGVDNVMMRKNMYGSKYQKHFLSWNTAPNLMPPNRQSSEGHEYPRAWITQKTSNEEYGYKFNVSRYTDKVHTSRVYVVSPEEGVRGWIPFAIGFNPLSLVEDDKLKVKVASCPDEFEIYKFQLIEAVSAMTKRPGTAYRPMGLGIFAEIQKEKI